MFLNSIIEISNDEVNYVVGGLRSDRMAWKEADDRDGEPKKNDPVSAAFAFGIMVVIGVIGLISIVVGQQQELDSHKEKEKIS